MNFNEIVKDILGSIFRLFGFHLRKELKGIVEYEHKVLLISIAYDFTRSFEVNVNFHFKTNNQSYSLEELKEYFYKEKSQFAVQILEEYKMKYWLEKFKVFLENHLKELTDNYVKICFELDGLRHQNVIDYNRERDERFFKEDVEKLWKSKDYIGLVGLIDNYKGIVDGALKKKYEYAIKKVG